jgi:hypothetical protein
VALAVGRPRLILWSMGVAVLGWLPFFVAAPGELLDQTFGFLGVQGLQRQPFPFGPGDAGLDPNKLLERYLPLILLAGAALYAVHAVVRRRLDPLAPLALVGIAYLLGRTDEFHLVPLAVALPLLLAGAAAREPRRAAQVALLAVVALVAVHGLERKAGQLLHRPALAPVPGPAGDGVRASRGEVRDLRRVRRALGGRSVFVAPPQFDRVTVGNPLLYVIADRDNPTRYDVIQPGIATTAEVQREMIEDLERERPDVLVRWRDRRTAPEDNGSGRERGATLLDGYLRRTYRFNRRIGVYALHVRR